MRVAVLRHLAPVVSPIVAHGGEHLARDLLQLLAHGGEQQIDEAHQPAGHAKLVAPRLSHGERGDRGHGIDLG